MVDPNLTPEQQARVVIDQLLVAAGWKIQNFDEMNPAAARGVAIREFPTGDGPVDYLLYGDRKAIGTIEAKKFGETLRSVETQSARYTTGFSKRAKQKGLPFWLLPLPFHFMSTGKATLFYSRLDPEFSPRDVFAFHRPETLIEIAKTGETLRQKLRKMPELDTGGLWGNQVEAITGLEASFAQNRLRTLIPQTMGAGKTTISRAEAYRLLRYGGARRILFMVDRINLGEQALREFNNYVTPDDGRKLGELYTVQLLRSNHIDPASNVVITTIQRLYSILRGEERLDPELEVESSFELEAPSDDTEKLPVVYQPNLPIEEFDFIFTDECHRSIYGRWGQVLDYFDAFLIGLTATPSKFTYGYFQGNVVAPYSHEQSVIDGVNVDYTVYRIDTEVTKQGATLDKGDWVQVRDRLTREQAYQELDDQLTYEATKLDRAVVSEDQIRTVIRTFRDKIQTEIFPGRSEVPKTVVFCKDDSHAEDVLKIIREEFGRGMGFARKITYKAEGSSQQLIQDFRTDSTFRIAVTVDQVSTGTDIKPIECLLMMRMVQSRSLFEQMKGRGVRKMEKNEFWAVTPGAQEDGVVKDHFVIVDCVGLTDEDRAWAATRPLDKKPTVPLKGLLQDIGQGITSDELLTTVAARLTRLRDKLTPDEEEEIKGLAGVDLHDLAEALVAATNDAKALAVAKEALGGEEDPSKEQLVAAKEELAQKAVTPLLDSQVRKKLLSFQALADQIIDISTQDKLIGAGFIDAQQAQSLVEEFEGWIMEHNDEYAALRAYYEKPYSARLSLDDIKDLARTIEAPPLNFKRARLWEAYEAVAKDRVRGEGGKTLADIVSLVRFAVGEDEELVPYADVVKLRFDVWLSEQEQGGRQFNPEQIGWLMMVRDHIAQSLTIESDDFDFEPFAQQGGLFGADKAFGSDLGELLNELNAELVP